MTASPSPAPKPAPKPGATPDSPPPPAKPDLGKPATGSTPQRNQSGHGTPATAGKRAAEPTIGQLVNDATTNLSALIHGEIELAKLELRSTVKNAGVGLGLFIGAAVVLVFSLVFGFLTLAEGISALGLSRWLSFLIVFVLQLLVVGLFVFVGLRKVKRIKAPARTIKTTKDTVDYLKQKRG